MVDGRPYAPSDHLRRAQDHLQFVAAFDWRHLLSDVSPISEVLQ